MERRSSSKSKGKGDRKFKREGFRRGHRPQRISIPKGTDINYKNIAFLQKCLTERGKIISRRLISGTAAQQRQLCTAVKIARLLGLLSSGSAKRK